LCHRISFSRNLRTVQSILVSHPLQGSRLEAQEVLAQTANIQLHGQERPPVVYSPIDHRRTQHPSQSKALQDLQLPLQIRRHSRQMENRRLEIIKRNLMPYHQKLYQRHPLIRARNPSHALVLRPGEQRTVQSLTYYIFPMMVSLGSSRCHHADYQHSKQSNKPL
jgi:hypothetical protein